MDTEEDRALKQAVLDGRPETDEGPYYHDSWWESYKGSIKGKLGGAIIGAAIGAAVGAATVAVLAFAAPGMLMTGGIAAVITAFTGAGLFYGQEEFSNVGTVTGAVAAAQEKAEERMKSFEKSKFAEIKQEIGELKAMVSGATGAKMPPRRAALDSNDDSPLDYRTHHSDEHGQPNGKLIFWKVAAIGLLIGAGIGAVIASSGLAAPILAHLGIVGTEQVMAAAATTFGLFGASFGINRDIFRKVFDNTDLWFKGIARIAETPEPSASIAAAKEIPGTDKTAPVATTITYENQIDYPVSNTYHRDRVLAAAEKSLLSFDHTRATPQ